MARKALVFLRGAPPACCGDFLVAEREFSDLRGDQAAANWKTVLGMMERTSRLKIFSAVMGLAVAVGAAQAQDVRFYLAYGDVATANRNGSSVGAELKTSAPFRVGPIGSRSVVSLWVVNTSSRRLTYGGGEIFVGVDRRSASGTKTSAFALGGQGRLSTDRFFNLAAGLSGVNNKGATTTANVSPLGNSFSGSGEAGTSVRSFGSSMGFGFGLGVSVVIASGQRVRLADVPIQNLTLLLGQTYGANTDNGITLNGFSGAVRGANFLGLDRGGWARATVKYSVQASL
jgi:hypothetical protein